VVERHNHAVILPEFNVLPSMNRFAVSTAAVSFRLQRRAASRANRSALKRSRLSWKAFCALS
jgi:hypothetical protein